MSSSPLLGVCDSGQQCVSFHRSAHVAGVATQETRTTVRRCATPVVVVVIVIVVVVVVGIVVGIVVDVASAVVVVDVIVIVAVVSASSSKG